MASPWLGPEFLPQLFKVVDLTVEDNRVAAGSRRHGLMPLRRKINDRKTAKRKPYAGGIVEKDAGIVWPAMGQRHAHAIENVARMLVSALGLPKACNATHRYLWNYPPGAVSKSKWSVYYRAVYVIIKGYSPLNKPYQQPVRSRRHDAFALTDI